MKNLISIILITISLQAFSQKMFVNVNNEPCIELYTDWGGPVAQVVCLNIADYYPQLTARDTLVLNEWSQLTDRERETWTGAWVQHGYAVEVVQYPVTTYLKNQPFIK